MVQNKLKSKQLVQNTHSFARVQSGYFLLQGKSSLLIFHFKSNTVCQCNIGNTEQRQKETRVFVSRAIAAQCIPLEKCPVSSCFFFFHTSVFLIFFL